MAEAAATLELTNTYQTRLAYLLAPYPASSTQPHLVDSSSTAKSASTSRVQVQDVQAQDQDQCSACGVFMVVGVNAVAQVKGGKCYKRCERCRKIDVIRGQVKLKHDQKGGRDQFESVKQRKKSKSDHVGMTSSAVDHRKQSLGVRDSASNIRDVEMQVAAVIPNMQHPVPIPTAKTPVKTSTLSDTRTTIPHSKSSATSAAPNPAPTSKLDPKPIDTSPKATNSKTKRVKASKNGLAELLAAKKLERERTEAQKRGGGMGLSDFLQSM